MRAEIDQLRQQQHQSDRILAALVSVDVPDYIIQRLRNGESIEKISSALDMETGKSATASNFNVSDNNANFTTYIRPSDQQAIQNALNTTASMTSSPFSATPYSRGFGGSIEGQRLQDEVSWPTWNAESSRHFSNSATADEIRWSPGNHGIPHVSSGYPLIGNWREQNHSEESETTIQWVREQGRGYILGHRFAAERDQSSTNLEPWTKVTNDNELVEHLMALYFCWEYPTFASLSKEHFLEDFRHGRRRHCSSLLVNTMLAVGCRFSKHPASRTDPNNSDTSGDHFFAEAVRLLAAEKNRHQLTTIQALGLMSLREASCGRSSESVYFAGQSVMIAIEMGLHLDRESGGGDEANLDHAVKSATFWGAFSLDQ
jgi:hypothetical protein